MELQNKDLNDFLFSKRTKISNFFCNTCLP